MSYPVVIIGLGQIGGAFAQGWLRTGRTVYPVTRDINPDLVAAKAPNPSAVLVSVTETGLNVLLPKLPKSWHPHLTLVQNELLPCEWEKHGIDNPTIAIVWFEKKRDQPIKVILPTVLCGPISEEISTSLNYLEVPYRTIERDELVFELVRKNLYILTSNIAGLEVGGTVGELWNDHRDLASAVAHELLDIQESRAGEELPRDELIEAMVEAFEADPDHKCVGRTAKKRLMRQLKHAAHAELDVPTLRQLADSL